MGSAGTQTAWCGCLIAAVVAACGARSELRNGQSASAGAAGATTGGASAGITGGGAASIAGTPSVAGRATGGGGGQSQPVSDAQLCQNYCKEHAVCVGQPDVCQQLCREDLGVGSGECVSAKRDRLTCLTRALAGMRCDGEPPLDIFERCGDYQLPPSACDDCETTLSETDSDCSMLRSCEAAGTAEVMCSTAGTNDVPCYCLVHGGSAVGGYVRMPVNEACRAADNHWLCFRELAPGYLP